MKLKDILALLAIVSVSLSAFGSLPEIEAGFARPPAESRPRTWWHWMDGHVSRSGITKDLEAMAAAGIGGASILDVSCFREGFHGPVKTLSPEWFDLVQFAIREAKRLGLSITVAACPGWSSTGGPWVRPAYAMKMLGSAETIVTGGRRIDQKLRRCDLPCGYGGDVAVLAFPTPPGTDAISYPDDADRVPDWRMKSYEQCVLNHRYPAFDDLNRPCLPGAAIDPKSLVDLTDRMTADGRLVWDAPAGRSPSCSRTATPGGCAASRTARACSSSSSPTTGRSTTSGTDGPRTCRWASSGSGRSGTEGTRGLPRTSRTSTG